jgi:hypothetical protein
LRHGAGSCPIGRVPANEIESTVIGQLRAVFRQPELIAGTAKTARQQDPDISDEEVREALLHLDPIWEELFPAEQSRIVQLLVKRIDISTDGLKLRFRDKGLM